MSICDFEVWGNSSEGYHMHGEFQPNGDPLFENDIKPLEPCPFCGEEEALEIRNSNTPFYLVHCKVCSASKDGAVEEINNPTDILEVNMRHTIAVHLAAKEWNRRSGQNKR